MLVQSRWLAFSERHIHDGLANLSFPELDSVAALLFMQFTLPYSCWHGKSAGRHRPMHRIRSWSRGNINSKAQGTESVQVENWIHCVSTFLSATCNFASVIMPYVIPFDRSRRSDKQTYRITISNHPFGRHCVPCSREHDMSDDQAKYMRNCAREKDRQQREKEEK